MATRAKNKKTLNDISSQANGPISIEKPFNDISHASDPISK